MKQAAVRLQHFVERYVRISDPMLWSVGCTVLTLTLAIMVGRRAVESEGSIGTLRIVIVVSSLVSSPAVALFATYMFYRRGRRDLQVLLRSFLSLLLTFANLYFALTFIGVKRDPPFANFHKPWSADASGKFLTTPSDILLAYVDAFHHSAQTATTVGFGVVHPNTWWAKLLTDLEVLLALSISIVGLGQYFSQSSRVESEDG